MDFDQKKAHILSEITTTSQESPDASPKGTIDTLCWPLINLINSHNDLVTTSSCSGRVSVFVEGNKTQSQNENEPQIGAKGNGGHWLFVTHNKEDLPNWWINTKFNDDMNQQQPLASTVLNNDTRYILFKYEPVIYHVKCRDFKIASKLYSTAMGCGFRESGIGANNNVAIRISIRLDIPIGIFTNDSNVLPLVSLDYIKTITKLANDRFLENERKMQLLFDRIKNEIIDVIPIVEPIKETKEERKLRKIQEGMARRDDVRKQKEEKRLLKALEQQKQQQQEQGQ